MNLDDLKQAGEAAEAIRQLNEKGVDFETARTMLVNQHRITFGEASRRIEAAEEIAGIRLGGDRATGTTPPALRGGIDPAAEIGKHIEYNYPTQQTVEDVGGESSIIAQLSNDGPPLPGETLHPRQRGLRDVEVEGAIYQVPKMTPEELQAFLPRCMVCGDPIPERRARARKETCGKPACGIALKQWRRAVLESKKCPACYHPSTPEEREDFRQWRRERGQIQRRAGNPHGKKPKTAGELLDAGLPLLREVRDMLKQSDFPGADSDWSKQFYSHLAEVEKLFASKPAT